MKDMESDTPIREGVKGYISNRLSKSISEGEQLSLFDLFPNEYKSVVKDSVDTIKKGLENGFISQDVFVKAMRNVGHLVPKRVQVKGKDGKIHQATRWVDPNTGESEKVSKPKREAEVYEGSDSLTIESVVSSSMSNADKVRNLFNLGVYDKSVVSLLTGMSPTDVKWYLNKESNVDETTLPSDKSEEIKNKIREEQKHNDTGEDIEKNELVNASRDVKKLWECYDRNLNRVITGRHKFAVCYGRGGVGKTFHCEQILEKLELREFEEEVQPTKAQYDYVTIKGKISPAQVYAEMYRHRDKLIIFDDCDSFLAMDEVQGFLKGGLDTGSNTKISNKTSRKVYNIEGDKDSGEIPSTFRFSGRVIAITNLQAEDIDGAIFSRALTSNLTMTVDETIDQIKSIKDKVKVYTADKSAIINVSQEARDKAFELLSKHKNMLDDGINTRVFGNAILLADDGYNDGLPESEINDEIKAYFDAVSNTFGKEEKRLKTEAKLQSQAPKK